MTIFKVALVIVASFVGAIVWTGIESGSLDGFARGAMWAMSNPAAPAAPAPATPAPTPVAAAPAPTISIEEACEYIIADTLLLGKVINAPLHAPIPPNDQLRQRAALRDAYEDEILKTEELLLRCRNSPQVSYATSVKAGELFEDFRWR